MSLFSLRQSAVTFAILGIAVGLGACRQEVRFTKAPAEGALMPRETREPTIVHLPIPIDLEPFREEVGRAIPNELVTTTVFTSAALCRGTGARRVCDGTRADIRILRAGEVRLVAEDARLVVVVPLDYSVQARGLGDQRSQRDTVGGRTHAKIVVNAALRPGFQADVDALVRVKIDEPSVAVHGAAIDLAPLIEAPLKALGPLVVRSLTTRLEQPSIAILVAQAWHALRTPISIGDAVSSWLVSEPVGATSMGFVSDGGRLALRMGIAARIRHVFDAPDRPAGPARPPVVEPAGAVVESTNLVISSWVHPEPLRQAMLKAMPRNQILESVVEGRSEPVRAKLRDVRLYPSFGRLCIELALDLIEPRRLSGRIGTLHLLAVPVVRPAGASLALDTIELADRDRPEKTYGIAHASETPHPRVTREPYADLISRAARMSVAREVRGVLPRINTVESRPLGNGVSLSADFGHAVVDAVLPEDDHIKISYELTGTLTLRIDPAIALAVQRANDNRAF